MMIHTGLENHIVLYSRRILITSIQLNQYGVAIATAIPCAVLFVATGNVCCFGRSGVGNA